MEEDCDGFPSCTWCRRRARPDYVVIAEPTACHVPRAPRPRISPRKAGTARRHCERDSALYKAARIMLDVERLNKKLKKDAFLGKGTVTVSCLWTQTPSLCSVPDGATIQLDRRLTAGESAKSALAEVRALPSVKATSSKVELLVYDATAWTGLKVGQDKYFPTWVLPEEHVLVTSAVTGHSGPATSPGFALGILHQRRGVHGPAGHSDHRFRSGEGVAHSTDEYVPVAHLTTAAAFYALYPAALAKGLAEKPAKKVAPKKKPAKKKA